MPPEASGTEWITPSAPTTSFVPTGQGLEEFIEGWFVGGHNHAAGIEELGQRRDDAEAALLGSRAERKRHGQNDDPHAALRQFSIGHRRFRDEERIELRVCQRLHDVVLNLLELFELARRPRRALAVGAPQERHRREVALRQHVLLADAGPHFADDTLVVFA
ncbi:MAG: hypothetical protein NTW87_24875, partial [Planctomycetota bacterium]|nr:hypothetical protein [Planctomycetota bacterium]